MVVEPAGAVGVGGLAGVGEPLGPGALASWPPKTWPNGRRAKASGVTENSGWTGVPASVLRIIREKTSAGNVPPATSMPCTPVMGTLPSGCPTQTAVASWGT